MDEDSAVIPSAPAEVTPRWLSRVLSTGDRAVEVSDVDVTAVGTGQTGATYRIPAAKVKTNGPFLNLGVQMYRK